MKKKVNQYLALGGRGECIACIYEMDDYLEKIKYLKENGMLDRQDEFAWYSFSEMLDKLNDKE